MLQLTPNNLLTNNILELALKASQVTKLFSYE
jgi:hypothetical protein